VSASARFLIESHSIRRVILIAHEGCGFYRKHFPGAKPSDVRKHQEDDLRLAAQALKHMPITIALYIAVIHDGHVTFERVE